jgi:hypothetical protein
MVLSMDGCSLFALLACFSWSNLYLDGDMHFTDADVQRTGHFTTVNHEGNAVETVITPFSYMADESPYGRFALGYQIEFKNVTLALEASHVSSLVTNEDRGTNAIGIKARWYPFR